MCVCVFVNEHLCIFLSRLCLYIWALGLRFIFKFTFKFESKRLCDRVNCPTLNVCVCVCVCVL